MKKKVILVSTVLALAVGVWAAARSFWPSSSESYFKNGKQYYDEKKYPEAAIQLLNAVNENPQNRDARYYLALSYLNQQDAQRAFAQLKTLTEFYPNDDEASLQLGNLYLSEGPIVKEGFTQARQIAERVLAKNAQNVDALILSGSASDGLKNYSAAVLMFERAINIDPSNVIAYIRLGASRIAQNRPDDAEQNFLKAYEIDRKSKAAIAALVTYYITTSNPNKAERFIKEGLAVDPTDSRLQRLAVQFYDGQGRFDEVEKLLTDTQIRAADPSPSLFLADLYEERDRVSDALKLLDATKQKFSKNVDVSAKVAEILITSQPARAKIEIDQILKDAPQNPIGHVLLGELQYKSGQYDAAEATLGTNPALDSRYPVVHFRLGDLAQRKAKIDEAISHYQKSLAVNNSGYLPARIALAEIFLQQGRLADAREQTQKALETPSPDYLRADYLRARLLKVTIDVLEKRFSDAEQEEAALLKEQPQNPDVLRQAALLEGSRGRGPEARKNFDRALELRPDSLEFLREMTALDIADKQVDRAIQRINAVPESKKQPFHYELVGYLYSQAGKSQEAEKAYRQALEKDPSRTSSALYLFEEYRRTGRTADSLQVLDDLLKKDPKMSVAYTLKGTVYESQGRNDQAKQSYAAALKVQPDSDVAANDLAYLLAEEGHDLQTALQDAKLARQRKPDEPIYADTLALVYFKMGDFVNAREQGLFAVSKQPANGTFLYHLAKSYEANYQIDDALKTMKRAVNSPSKDFKERSLAEAALKELSR